MIVTMKNARARYFPAIFGYPLYEDFYTYYKYKRSFENLGRDLDNATVSLILQRKNSKFQVQDRNIGIITSAIHRIILVYLYVKYLPISVLFIFY